MGLSDAEKLIATKCNRARVGAMISQFDLEMTLVFGSNPCMSKIPPEPEAKMTTAVKAASLVLLDRIERLPKQVESLTNQVGKLTPRISSLPPSTEHPDAKPKRQAALRKSGNRMATSGTSAN